MKLNETQKVDTNLYELNITVDGEQYAKALVLLSRRTLPSSISPVSVRARLPRASFTRW